MINSMVNVLLHCLTNSFSVEGEFQFAQSMDGNTTEEIQEALEESIKGKTVVFGESLY